MPSQAARARAVLEGSRLVIFPPEISCGETLPTGPQPSLLPIPTRPGPAFPRDIVDFAAGGPFVWL